jgi:F-type H+-transporting ATPase subunit b
MDLITPGLGIIFWQTVTLLFVLFILGKFAWKPILNILKQREAYVEKSLQEAQEAKQLLTTLKEEQAKMLLNSEKEREKLLKEAMDSKEKILSEARIESQKMTDKLLQEAREVIAAEQAAAFNKLKNELMLNAVQIAEKLIKKELNTENKQEELVRRFVQESTLN